MEKEPAQTPAVRESGLSGNAAAGGGDWKTNESRMERMKGMYVKTYVWKEET